MGELREFHYRLPHRIGGWRPGSHRGSSLGGAQEFVSHMRLYDRPDPRRLDLRASLRNIQQDWLVRVNRQRSSIPVHAIVDVSASMSFGSPRSKLEVAADFIAALGQSAFRAGDSLGMLAFDGRERMDLFVPARVSRGMGDTMARLLRKYGRTQTASGAARDSSRGKRPPQVASPGAAQGLRAANPGATQGLQPVRPGAAQGRQGLSSSAAQGLHAAIQHLAGKRGLVFLVSDFHWPLAGMDTPLDSLAHSFVVPLVVWDPAEIEPPTSNGLMQLRDMESGAQRTLWMRPRVRADWRDSIAARRSELNRVFAERAMLPFYVSSHFDSEALSRYFFQVAP